MPLSRALFLLPLLLLLAACPGRRTAQEVGATQCNDGLDNDDDGKIDCQDPDCHPLAICSPTDLPVRLDGSPRDGPRPPDQGPVADLKPVQPDLPPPSSYGKRCQAGSAPIPCPDGKTECVIGNYGTPGFCTVPCIKGGPPCPEGPPGTETHCGYEVQWDTGAVWYCLFYCQNGAPCPHDTQCISYPFCF